MKNRFVCPYDHHNLSSDLACGLCKRIYPITNGVPNFLPDGLREWTVNFYSSKKRLKKQNSSKGTSWKPGFRGWHPGKIIKFLSFGIGEGRIYNSNSGSLLDVGCGDVAKGDVNTDVYIPNPLPKNFVLATAEMLPFADNSFDVVRSAYVIEHNLYPTEMVKEHYRVAKRKVEVFTDNSDWVGVYFYRLLNVGSIFHDEHYFKWSVEYFRNILNRLGYTGTVSVFNTSPSFLVRALALFGKLPRMGLVFYRDLYVEIYKK